MGEKLIVHGGMRSFNGEYFEDENDHKSSYSASSNSYATYKTSPKWMALSDVWEFDLLTLQWKERIIYPQLSRSYHSLVGWGNGLVAAFGGFQQDNNLGGEVSERNMTLF